MGPAASRTGQKGSKGCQKGAKVTLFDTLLTPFLPYGPYWPKEQIQGALAYTFDRKARHEKVMKNMKKRVPFSCFLITF